MKGHEMHTYEDGFEMSGHEPHLPDDPDAVDRDPYLIPEPGDDDEPDGRPGPDEGEGPGRFPGDEAPDRMLVDDSDGGTSQG